jgi:alginate O-acetyltransferase complex protein AlgI
VLFPTIQFGIFFPIVFVASWLLRPRPKRWKLFMVAASYVFYAFAYKGGWFTWDRWRYPALLAGVTVVNQVLVVGIFEARARSAKKTWLTLAVVADVGCLGYFKYYNFARDSLRFPLPATQVILPVAISFFIFQALSYVIDAYRDDLRPTTLLDFATYLSFFPHLVAGPIVRARELLPQLRQKPDPRHIDASRAFRLIIAGMFKKVVIADKLAAWIVDSVFANPKGHTALENLSAVYAYAIQIYADFSGYTDIAIGLALLLGIRFPVNFDAPYTATSMQEFWRRWHMSLSRWLRDYLYISLGGNRGSNLPGLRRWLTPAVASYLNLMLVMLIGGLWHGASWKFVVWGAIHGVALAVERLLHDRRARLGYTPAAPTVLGRVARWLVTFHVVCFAWIFFRAQDFAKATDVIGQIATGWSHGVGPLVTLSLVLVIAAMILSQFVPEWTVEAVQARFSRLPLALQGSSLAVCFFLIEHLGPVGVAPFIYFQF